MRHLSLILAESVRYEQVQLLIHSVKPEHLEDLEYVTTYRGKPLEKGMKSLTVKLVFRAAEKTLTGEEVEGPVKKIIDTVAAQLGATLRM